MTIIAYTKAGCPWCKGVIDMLNERGIAYVEKEVRSNPANLKELVAKSGKEMTPTLDIDGEILADTDREAAEIKLKELGIVGE